MPTQPVSLTFILREVTCETHVKYTCLTNDTWCQKRDQIETAFSQLYEIHFHLGNVDQRFQKWRQFIELTFSGLLATKSEVENAATCYFTLVHQEGKFSAHFP